MDSFSVASFQSSSPSSLYTTTSSSTQWGPGALAGKAILGLGKAVIRGVEYLVISRRISAIKAFMPCWDDNVAQSGNLERMFDDLLELSRHVCVLRWHPGRPSLFHRSGLYPKAIHREAMQIILVQIAKKETYHLCLSLSRWEIEHAELVNFLLEIIGVVLFSKRG